MPDIKKKIEELEKLGKVVSRLLSKKGCDKNLKEGIVKSTSFLPGSDGFAERIYCIKNNIIEVPKCKTCGNPSHFNKSNPRKGYYGYCSTKCQANDSEVRKRVTGNRDIKAWKEKMKKTCLEKYGVDNIFNDKERIRKAIENKYGSYKNKLRITCFNKHGVDNPNYIGGMLEKKKQNSLKRYGVDSPSKLEEVREKRKQTCLKNNEVGHPFQLEQVKVKKKERFKEKYGVDNPSQVKEFQNKKKGTWIRKYGVDHPWKRADIKAKRDEVCLEKYGTKYPLQSEIGKEQVKQTCLEKYGVDNVFKSTKFLLKQRELYYQNLFSFSRLKNKVKPLFSLEEYHKVDKKYKFQCLKCNNEFEDHLDNGRIPRCYNCFPKLVTYKSKYEEEIYNWLSDLGISTIQKGNMSIINPYQLDIYIPDRNLAIEFNGLYWHSEIGSYGKCNGDYHLTKTNLCKEKGIELIHIFEDEWIENPEIVKSIIKSKLGLITNKIYARECEIRETDKEEALVFLMNNHLQEALNGKYSYGLYYKDKLVSLISLSKPRFNKNYEYELIRSCSRKDIVVVGGFSKLIDYAINKLNISSIVSYVDKRYFNGKGYKEWGLMYETSPNYFYTKDYQNRESRIKYQKHKLEKLFPDIYDKSLTEWQIMQLAGYDRIWDVGNKVFERTAPQCLPL